MSGIYIHIPFCKQACHYCDFHFSTNFKKKDDMVAALAKELVLRKHEFTDQKVGTIYFGGGTPSVLSASEINFLIETVYRHFDVSDNPEITLEANPDDLSDEKILELSESKVNRLSIGIQSFYDEDLKMMNRAHNSAEAEKSLAEAAKHFDNITIDLIYGIPGMDDERWKTNIKTALSFGIPHVSAYALTVEPKTALKKMIAEGKVNAPKDEVAERHFRILTESLNHNGFVHYELSNFGKPGYFSRNNSAYWLGKKYLGIGPSAHSFDGKSRSWNVANNSLYLKGIASGELPSETEFLSEKDRYNEYVMTGLRTIWGISLEKVEQDFGSDFKGYLLREAQNFLSEGLLSLENDVLKATPKGKFLTDGIASDLFWV
ncbi:radical SAM family heme chaperone HemW [Flavobacterium sp. MAH-1]|uniref:Heme chaperone HemW n=1 Tax=Flavobacterium agri TaxID=2743471 RepID=A0A7Y9C6R8_9FLAO|nr:radical SAM family heme chaperone HemW [Flavobacterium agri]NUY80659.1 radical SAM family heme chaperone HemW [Flavobacterium agri]NYA70683.1 radical SAM family heme chaperone HemW [Flavobacterium agri]